MFARHLCCVSVCASTWRNCSGRQGLNSWCKSRLTADTHAHTRAHNTKMLAEGRVKVVLPLWRLRTFLFASDLTESTGFFFGGGSFAFLFQKPDLNFQNNIDFFSPEDVCAWRKNGNLLSCAIASKRLNRETQRLAGGVEKHTVVNSLSSRAETLETN